MRTWGPSSGSGRILTLQDSKLFLSELREQIHLVVSLNTVDNTLKSNKRMGGILGKIHAGRKIVMGHFLECIFQINNTLKI